jgi:hypothetical protein
LRVLLGPADLRRGERFMIFRGGRDDTPAFVDDDRASPSRSDIYAEYVDRASLDSRSPLRENTEE